MNVQPQDSIALLIDADNSPSSKIDFIISELASHGVVNIRRAYGNWTKRGLTGWIEVLHGYAIQPMQSFDLFAAIDLFEIKAEKTENQTRYRVRLLK
jgi:uncharacterized membrane protein (DUF2068 family)